MYNIMGSTTNARRTCACFEFSPSSRFLFIDINTHKSNDAGNFYQDERSNCLGRQCPWAEEK
jgi:hypothetical protein